MRIHSLLLGICLVSGVALAQEGTPTPREEVGFNYSYVYLATAQATNGNQNGGSGYVEYNLNTVVGLVADFGGYATRNAVFGGNTGTTFTYLFGPRFNWRKSRVVPYAQFLFGGADAGLSAVSGSTTRNGFATAAGAGVDIAVTSHVALKPIQVEYVRRSFRIPRRTAAAFKTTSGIPAAWCFSLAQNSARTAVQTGG